MNSMTDQLAHLTLSRFVDHEQPDDRSAIDELSPYVDQLTDEQRDALVQMAAAFVGVNQLPDEHWDEKSYRGWSTDDVSNFLYRAKMRGDIADYTVRATVEGGIGAEWSITYQDGTETGVLSFNEAVDAVEALDVETVEADPTIMVALQEAVEAGLIDSYAHEPLDGQPMYVMRVERDGKQMEQAGYLEATRAALWGLFVGGAAGGDE